MTADPARWWLAAFAVGLWLALTGWSAWRARRAAARPILTTGEDGWRVVVSSQTGFGAELAAMTAQALRAGGQAATVIPLGRLDAPLLARARRLLFVVSTTGEGDAPDDALAFVRRLMPRPAALDGLSYGLLALGDRTYRDFCGFGRAVDDWMGRSGATALFERIEVDDGDADALGQWRAQVAGLAGSPDGAGDGAAWAAPGLRPWRLTARARLNPDSPGGPVFDLSFTPAGDLPDWRAGDIAEIELPPEAGGGGAREYSVASLPSDGRLRLLVRRMTGPDGTPGRMSGWLCERLEIGGEVGLRIRPNPAFHGPDAATPLILIGAGTGLAGLMGHLRAREAGSRAWLMFGERTAAHDAFLDAELQALLASGRLTRLDRAFSRDPGDGRYVQHLIAENADAVRAWVAQGAALYVCGAREGMAPGVHAALETALGAGTPAAMMESGRYRRDVY